MLYNFFTHQLYLRLTKLLTASKDSFPLRRDVNLKYLHWNTEKQRNWNDTT